MVNNYPINMVTIKKLAELTGYSEAALRKKVHDNVFKEGIHYVRSPDHRIQVDLEAYILWIETNGHRG